MTEMKRPAQEVNPERLQSQQNGWYPVNIYNAIVGDAKTGKHLKDAGWQRRPETNKPINYHESKTNTGIVCHDIMAFDIDVNEDQPDAQEIADKCYNIIKRIAGAESIVRRRSNSTRLLTPYRVADGERAQKKVKVKNNTTNHAVEGLATGEQFVAFGGHYTGTWLEWDNNKSPANTPILSIPAITEDQIYQIMDECCEVMGGEWVADQLRGKTTHKSKTNIINQTNQTNGVAITTTNGSQNILPRTCQSIDFATLQNIVNNIPNNKTPYDQWQPIMSAIFNTGMIEGLDMAQVKALAKQWSDQDPDRKDFPTKWKQYDRGQSTDHDVMYLIKLASTYAIKNKKQLTLPTIFPSGYTMRDDGLYWIDQSTEEQKAIKIADHFKIIGETANANGSEVALIIEFDYRDKLKQLAIKKGDLVSGKDDYLITLADNGLNIKSAYKTKFKKFLEETKAESITHTNKSGWHDNAFIMADGTTHNANQSNKIILNPSKTKSAPNVYMSNGSFDGWKTEIAKLAIGNPAIAFHVCASLAGPLLDLAGGMSGGGFHFYGNSRSGKSTMLKIAASIWGKPDTSGQVRTWRTTDNSLESIAEMTNDLTLFLDEISQCDNPKIIGQSAYMLANGAGKGRANQTGEAKEIKTFKILFLSNGERTLSNLIDADNKNHIQNAGIGVRMIDVPVDYLTQYINLHGFTDVKSMYDSLNANCKKFYGHAGNLFLDELVKARQTNESDLQDFIKQITDDFKTATQITDAHPQIHTIAERFALCAAAGELAIEWGILPWIPGEARRNASICFQAAYNARKSGADADEKEQAIRLVREFMQTYDSHFEEIGGATFPPRIRYGYKDDGYYYFNPLGFKEAIKGMNDTAVAKTIHEAGYLIKTDNRFQVQLRFDGTRQRVYKISRDILDT